MAAAVLLGIVAGFVVAQREPDASATSGATATTSPDAAGAVIEPDSVTSFDPVGGSGFRDDGNGTWATQTYRTAQFGALKDGVGLLIDLGEPRPVTSVTLEQATPGLSVQMLAADEPPSGSVEGWTATDEVTTGDGETTLSGGDGAAHRYWMVWVSELAASGDGFAATVSTPVVEGPAA
jgi:putative peptidoglycan lipid II flippase